MGALVQEILSASWSDVWAALTAISTTLFLGVGLLQISAARRQAKGWQTLVVCERYESDPVLDGCLRALFKARADGSLEASPAQYRIEISTILNYLDGIAIGIEQKLYLEPLARDHMEEIVEKHVKDYLSEEKARATGIELASYKRLLALNERWSKKSTQPTYFRDGKWWPF